MADTAKSQATGKVVSAKDLKEARHPADDAFECPSCGVGMIPVACGPGPYKVTEHFRAAEPHAGNCVFDGVAKQVELGETRPTENSMGPPRPKPSKYVTGKSRQSRAGEDSAERASPRRRYRRDPASPSAPGGLHESTRTSILPFAIEYFGKPPAREEPLEVVGFKQRTYEDCIKGLFFPGAYHKIKRPILFAPIRFLGLELDRPGHEMKLDLDADRRKPGKKGEGWRRRSAPYRLLVRTGEWDERTRSNFRARVEEAARIQKGYYRKKEQSPVVAFFLCQQDEDDLSTFVVDDHRDVCFYDTKAGAAIS